MIRGTDKMRKVYLIHGTKTDSTVTNAMEQNIS